MKMVLGGGACARGATACAWRPAARKAHGDFPGVHGGAARERGGAAAWRVEVGGGAHHSRLNGRAVAHDRHHLEGAGHREVEGEQKGRQHFDDG